jgi:hypothetical protein
MPKLKEWLQKHDYPFEFTTEASINIADDDDMLQAMKDANFFGIFVGIESPDPETLSSRCARSRTPSATSPRASTRSTATACS